MRQTLLLLLLGLLCASVQAESYKDWSTTNVSQDDGDTVSTTQVSVGVCPGTSCPTLISAAVTDRSLRRRMFSNVSTFRIYVGSNTTTLSTTGFAIGESTSTYPMWLTHSTAAIYGSAVSTGTITVIRSSNSIP